MNINVDPDNLRNIIGVLRQYSRTIEDDTNTLYNIVNVAGDYLEGGQYNLAINAATQARRIIMTGPSDLERLCSYLENLKSDVNKYLNCVYNNDDLTSQIIYGSVAGEEMKCPIGEIVDAINTAAGNLRESTDQLSSFLYADSEWDDDVKESYRNPYLCECYYALEIIENISNKLRRDCNDISEIDTGDIIESANAICAAIWGV